MLTAAGKRKVINRHADNPNAAPRSDRTHRPTATTVSCLRALRKCRHTREAVWHVRAHNALTSRLKQPLAQQTKRHGTAHRVQRLMQLDSSLQYACSLRKHSTDSREDVIARTHVWRSYLTEISGRAAL